MWHLGVLGGWGSDPGWPVPLLTLSGRTLDSWAAFPNPAPLDQPQPGRLAATEAGLTISPRSSGRKRLSAKPAFESPKCQAWSHQTGHKASCPYPTSPQQALLAPHNGWRVYILKYLNAAENKNYLHSPAELAGHFKVCDDGVSPSPSPRC